MDYIEVSFKLNPYNEEFAEIVLALAEDFEFESFSTEEPFVKGYIKADKFLVDNLELLSERFENIDAFSVEIDSKLVKGENWNALWESNFPPLVIDDICTVKASFHKALPETKYNITIDPKMAFGTGHHQTTHLMAAGLMRESVTAKRVLDMGCGTGILAILAAKMGAGEVVAIDNDSDASDSAKENALKNNVTGRISVFQGDAGNLGSMEGFDFVLANINRNIVINDIPWYSKVLVPEGVLLLSGFYDKDVEMVTAAGLREGLVFISSDTRDKWAFIKMQKGKNCVV